MKKETKRKIKDRLNKLKKPLMILSIVFNILFALALVIGLSSKPKAQGVSATYGGDEVALDESSSIDMTGYVFHMRAPSVWNTSGLTATGSSKVYLNIINEISYGEYSSGERSNFNYIINSEYASVYRRAMIENGWNSSGTTATYPFMTIDASWETTGRGYVYYHTGSGTSNRQDLGDVGCTIEILGGEDVTNQAVYDLLSSNAVSIENPNAPVIDEDNVKDTISLGDAFNPVTYITQNGDYILNGFAGKHTNANTTYLDLTGLTFKSNGQVFNRIRFTYVSLTAGAPVVTQDGTSYLELGSDYSSYMCCIGGSYQYLENDILQSSVSVFSYRKTLIDDNGIIINAYDVRPPYIIWFNNNYRSIEVLEDDESIVTGDYLTINGLTAKELLQVTSSVNTNVMGFTDVVGLIKTAFTGIGGILGIAILPGITLGLLLFIPLIVTIIIVVVRLIKK